MPNLKILVQIKNITTFTTLEYIEQIAEEVNCIIYATKTPYQAPVFGYSLTKILKANVHHET